LGYNPNYFFAPDKFYGTENAIRDFIDECHRQGIAVIMIEHIMRAVSAFSQRLVVLAAGKKIADGPTQEVLRDPLVERIYLGD
jgi:branched-chain amino acid transport system ATP-binding protein